MPTYPTTSRFIEFQIDWNHPVTTEINLNWTGSLCNCSGTELIDAFTFHFIGIISNLTVVSQEGIHKYRISSNK